MLAKERINREQMLSNQAERLKSRCLQLCKEWLRDTQSQEVKMTLTDGQCEHSRISPKTKRRERKKGLQIQMNSTSWELHRPRMVSHTQVHKVSRFVPAVGFVMWISSRIWECKGILSSQPHSTSPSMEQSDLLPVQCWRIPSKDWKSVILQEQSEIKRSG